MVSFGKNHSNAQCARAVFVQMVQVFTACTHWPWYLWLTSLLNLFVTVFLNLLTTQLVFTEDWDAWEGPSGSQQEGDEEEHAGYSGAGPSHDAEADIDDPDFNVSDFSVCFDIQIIL